MKLFITKYKFMETTGLYISIMIETIISPRSVNVKLTKCVFTVKSKKNICGWALMFAIFLSLYFYLDVTILKY
jgi:hypothetical protein